MEGQKFKATFQDGPARGEWLDIARNPMVLRVTKDGSGKVDALDLLEDAPRDDEEVFVYVLESTGTAHVDRVVKGKRVGEWFTHLHYRLMSGIDCPQDVRRDNARWRAWCESNRDALIPERFKRRVAP